MNIDYLADHPEFIPILARQMAEHWRDIIPGEDSWRRFAALNAHKNRDRLPLAWVAHENGQPLGTCALRKCDLEGWERLTPWLAGVFVMPSVRGRGVAKELCRVAEDKAWAWGAPRLYLHTPDRQGLYLHLGWQRLKMADWNGLETTIMVKERTNVCARQL